MFVSSIIFVGLIYPKYGCSFKWHYCYSDDVFNYPSKIILDGTEYSFGAQRSSNYQLGSTTHFLSILITLRKNNSDNFTSWIKVTRIWLRKDNIILTILTILTAECSDSSHLISGNKYSKFIGCGPEWGKGSLIDVAILQ